MSSGAEVAAPARKKGRKQQRGGLAGAALQSIVDDAESSWPPELLAEVDTILTDCDVLGHQTLPEALAAVAGLGCEPLHLHAALDAALALAEAPAGGLGPSSTGTAAAAAATAATAAAAFI